MVRSHKVSLETDSLGIERPFQRSTRNFMPLRLMPKEFGLVVSGRLVYGCDRATLVENRSEPRADSRFRAVSISMSPIAADSRRPERSPKLRKATRGLLALAALAVAAIFGEARRLEPNPKGYGTHEQMGLPPCAFLKATGIPCPSCGLTTSFAWIARGRFRQAGRANPAGLAIAPLFLVAAVWCGWAAIRGRPLGSDGVEIPLMCGAVFGVGVSLLTWTIRLLLRR